MHIDLSDAEIDYLQRALTHDLGELRMEIVSTDTFDFKAQLEQDEQVLRGLLSRLGAPPEGGVAL
jgi:hypothetical protein